MPTLKREKASGRSILLHILINCDIAPIVISALHGTGYTETLVKHVLLSYFNEKKKESATSTITVVNVDDGSFNL